MIIFEWDPDTFILTYTLKSILLIWNNLFKTTVAQMPTYTLLTAKCSWESGQLAFNACSELGGKRWHVWGLWCQKQAFQAGISNCIPQNTAGCHHLSLPQIPASGPKVLIYTGPRVLGDWRNWRVPERCKYVKSLPFKTKVVPNLIYGMESCDVDRICMIK